jgi:hypothetical protein
MEQDEVLIMFDDYSTTHKEVCLVETKGNGLKAMMVLMFRKQKFA